MRFLLPLIAIVLLAGCSSTRTTRVVLDEPSAVVTSAPDTLLTVAPMPLADIGTPTRPLQVRRYARPDTSRRTPVRSVEVADGRLTLDYGTRAETYRLPASGETLQFNADEVGDGFDVLVRGQKETRTIEIETGDQGRNARFLVYSLAVLLALVFIIRVVR